MQKNTHSKKNKIGYYSICKCIKLDSRNKPEITRVPCKQVLEEKQNNRFFSI